MEHRAVHFTGEIGKDKVFALEQALTDELKRKQREQWLKENAEAIEAYNKFVDEHSVFSDGLRSF